MSSNVRPDSGLLSGLRSDAQFVLETNGLRVASDVSSDTTYVVRAASGERLAAEERLENYEDVRSTAGPSPDDGRLQLAVATFQPPL